ncbi:MAG: Stf0 family sulfotransferase [Coleofasciculus sp. C1-SOL-03]|uniref:Stf0 family sulfotransferase n=1 Tax=Coleofasciculus sp. C1-SOL-03 TaxID=3069522 RepID=UPI0032F4D631
MELTLPSFLKVNSSFLSQNWAILDMISDILNCTLENLVSRAKKEALSATMAGKFIRASRDITRELYTYPYALNPIIKSASNKFLVLAQPRTGSTLLFDLLNSHPKISCEGNARNAEILRKRLAFPLLFINGRTKIHCDKVYGFKLITNHLQIQNIKNEERFIENLYDQGFQIIFLKRTNILKQSLSIMSANSTGVWHIEKWQDQTTLTKKKIQVNCKLLMQYMEALQRQEKQYETILKNLPHLGVTYEKDLLGADKHQQTLNRIFEYLGILSRNVETSLLKIGSESLSDSIQNYEELVETISGTEYAKFLDE